MDLREIMILATVACSVTIAHAQPGMIDPSFSSAIQSGGGANGPVYCVASDLAGNTLLGGAFTQVNGIAANRIARIKPDGTLDTAFTTAVGLVGLDVKSIAVQEDGMILLGGNFSSIASTPRNFLARLGPTGALDLSFAPVLNLPVHAIAVQPDGAILVGGQFFFNPGFTRRSIARFHSTGVLDTSFDPGTGANNTVNSVALASNGNIVVAGAFTQFNSSPAGHVMVLDGNGTPVPGFNPSSGADGEIFAATWLANGDLLLGGSFDHFNGASHPALVCVDPNGAVSTGMNIPGFSNTDQVSSIKLDMNALPVCGGTFTAYNGSPRSKLLRLRTSGALDVSFLVGAGFTGTVVSALAIDPDGAILAGGTFSSYQGVPQSNVTRITDCLEFISYRDADGDGFGDPNSDTLSCEIPPGFTDNPEDCNDADGNLWPGAPCDDGDPNTVGDALNALCQCEGGNIRIAAKAFLQGPFNGTDMNDNLRTGGLLPTTEPYVGLDFINASEGGGETVDPAVFDITGPDAIVDWVMLQLLSANLEVKITRMALIQRDGDIVDLDGVSPVLFLRSPSSYHLAVRHRNHLGIMTADTLPTTPTGTVIEVDLTSPNTACWGTEARKNAGGVMVMWAGNTNLNDRLSYTGSGNDRDPILTFIGSTTPNNVIMGQYTVIDSNMNGSVSYTGSGNDRDLILSNVGSTTPNNQRFEQLP